MITFELSGWNSSRRSRSRLLNSFFIPFVLLLGGTACNVSEPEEEVPSRFHRITLIDSTLGLSARFPTGQSHPELRIQLSLALRIDADSGRVIHYSVQAAQAERQYLPPPNTIPYGSQYSLSVIETFQSLSPWTSNPSIRVRVEVKTWVGTNDSTKTVEIHTQRPVSWVDAGEPGLRSVTMKTGYELLGGIAWAGDNLGFYFHSRWTQNQNEVIQYFRLSDSSIADVSPTSGSFRLLDVSHDQQFLLLADGGTRASNLYLYNKSGSLHRLLVEARDSAIITSGRFSHSDYRVAFSTVRGVSRTEPGVRLFDARDSTVTRFDLLSSFPAHTILTWLPSSNDRFVFHAGGAHLHVFSVGSRGLTSFGFPSPFLPRALLPDGFTVMGWRVEGTEEDHVWLYTIGGEPVKQLTFLGQATAEASISPNGRNLTFIGRRGGALRLFVLPLSGVFDKH